MKLCRYSRRAGTAPRVGCLLDTGSFRDLTAVGVERLDELLEQNVAAVRMSELAARAPVCDLSECSLLAPVESQEIWAAGLTYPLARAARMLESPQSAVVHNLIYEAERPKIFFKSIAEKVVASGESVGVRSDSHWSVPEPELALVLNSRGEIAGYAVANDMTSRDIESENLLYSPQAKIYHRSCSIGPWVRIGATPEQIRAEQISVRIIRLGVVVYANTLALADIHRSFDELITFLFRCQRFSHGVVLLTGTGIVAPESVNLVPHDQVEISISGIGDLTNNVVSV